MQKYAAFLRAINVGGHTVKMDALRGLFEALGFAGVETFIASGNVIFEAQSDDASALEREIETHLRENLGYEVATFIRTLPELTDIAHCQPFPAADAGLYVAFLAETPSDEGKQKVLALASPVDSFHISGRELYWLCRVKSHESAFSGAVLEKTLGMKATLRNNTTIQKMAAKFT